MKSVPTDNLARMTYYSVFTAEQTSMDEVI